MDKLLRILVAALLFAVVSAPISGQVVTTVEASAAIVSVQDGLATDTTPNLGVFGPDCGIVMGVAAQLHSPPRSALEILSVAAPDDVAATARNGVMSEGLSFYAAMTDTDDTTITSGSKGGKHSLTVGTINNGGTYYDATGALTTVGNLSSFGTSADKSDYGLGYESLTTVGVSATLSGTRSVIDIEAIATTITAISPVTVT